jgi:hypothetical protein
MIFFCKKNITIFFFLVYFIFAYLISWLLLNPGTGICTNYIVINNISNEFCLYLKDNDYFYVIKLFVLWLLFFFFTLKILLKIKFTYLEMLFNRVIKKISVLNLSKKNFIFIFVTINFIVLSSFFLDAAKLNFIFDGFKFLHFFLFLFFLRTRQYGFLFFNIFALLPTIYFGEISILLFIFISLNLYILILKEKISFSFLLKTSFLFFFIFLILIKSQNYFKNLYGYPASYKIFKLNNLEQLFLKNSKPETFSLGYFDSDQKFSLLYIDKLEPSFKSPFHHYSQINLDYQKALNRISEVHNTAYVLYLINNHYADTINGATYAKIPYLLIPRFIYPNKPKETFGNVLSCNYGVGWTDYKNKEDCIKRNYTSVNLNVFLEGYINFKYLGIFLSSLIIATILRVIILLQNNKNYVINTMSMCLFYQAIQYSSNLSGVLGGLIICVFFLLFITPFKLFNE